MNRRYFIKLGALGTLISSVDLLSCAPSGAEDDADIVVVGGTPAGIMAAIAAARQGARVVLIEYHDHIGGLSTSGLGKSDIENKDAIAGLFKEFTKRVLEYYTGKYGADSENVKKCREGYYYEPSVAEQVFKQMVEGEKNITLILGHQIEEVAVASDQVQEAVFRKRSDKTLRRLKAAVFVDATYEGDVYALAGAAYRLGREGREDFNELHAGKIFFDYNENRFLDGSTGVGDKRVPAYTYRLCLTDDPANSYVMKTPPPGYRRENYLRYFEDLKEGRLSGPKVFKEGHGYYKAHFDTMVRVFSFAEIPNGKYDVNTNPRPLGFPFPEENFNYVEESWEAREKVFQRHRDRALGLLYFVQNDPEVPEAHRKLANQYHLPLDEFTDNGHFPWQLYVREARRLKGVYTLSENDVTLQEGAQRTTVFEDSVIAGEFPIDSFPCSKEASPDRKVLEGYIGMLPIHAYQVPYRILIPEKIDGIIVPVAASTTHVAYSTIRMEPLWMGIGQAAGIAAWLSVRDKVAVRDVPVQNLQKLLLEEGQILTYFDDLDISDPAATAIQFWGTKGFFDTYRARTGEPLTADVCGEWSRIACRVLGVKDDSLPTTENGEITIGGLKRIIDTIYGRIGAGTTGKEGIAALYPVRGDDLPVLRGEACRLYYALLG